MESSSRKIKKYLVLTSVFVIVALVLYLLLRTILFSEITVVIEGNHNPVTDTVVVNGQRVFASGQNGKIYSSNTIIGTKDIVLAGPFVETQTTEATSSPFSDSNVNIKTKQISETELASKLIEASATTEIYEVRKFSSAENNWITIITGSPSTTENREMSLYTYDTAKAEWILLEKGAKVSPYFEGYRTAPKNLLAYLETEAGD